MSISILVYTYLQTLQHGFPEAWRPTVCPHCNRERSFHHHGKRNRLVVLLTAFHWIPIYRFKCKICKHTQSVIPSFVLPGQQASLELQEHVLSQVEEGQPLNPIHENMPPESQHSEKTLWRWKKRWQKLIDLNAEKIWPVLLKQFPLMHLPQGKDKPQSNPAWFLRLWQQLHDRRCFLEWLTSDFHPLLTGITGD